MHIDKWKKQVGKGYILYNWFQLYNILEKRQNYKDSNRPVVVRGWSAEF